MRDEQAADRNAVDGARPDGTVGRSLAGELSERDRRILDFEQNAPASAARREIAIRQEFGLTAPRYQQLLGFLIEKPAALAYAPMLVGRLLRLRDVRAEARSSRTFGSATTGANASGRQNR